MNIQKIMGRFFKSLNDYQYTKNMNMQITLSNEM